MVFDFKTEMFKTSINGPDGSKWNLQFPVHVSEDVIPLDIGKTLCISYFVDHDWIEYAVHTERGDFDVSIESEHASIEDQILDMWEFYDDPNAGFDEFMFEEFHENICRREVA